MFVFFMVFASVGHFALDVQTPENTPGPGKAMVVMACFFITAVCSQLPRTNSKLILP